MLGLSRITVYKVRTGRVAPSERFIGGVLRAWPGVDLRDLLEAVDYKREVA